MTKLKCWKKRVNQKDNEWWQIGENKQNKLWLPKKWIHLGKTSDPQTGKTEYEVRADSKINKKTIYGKSKFFKSKPLARRFVNNYMRKNDKC